MFGRKSEVSIATKSVAAPPPEVAPTFNDDPFRTEATRLVDLDQKSTLDLLTRLVAVQSATRATAVPVASGFAALALANHSVALAMLVIPVVVLSMVIEARAGDLQQRAHARSTYLERITQANLRVLAEQGKATSELANRDLRRLLDGYQYGASRSLRAVRARAVFRRMLRQASTLLYLGLIILLVAGSVIIITATPQPTVACLQTAPGTVVRVEGEGVKLSGDVSLVPCPP